MKGSYAGAALARVLAAVSANAQNARLGDIHVVLLSHAHGDHIGDQKLKALGATPSAPGSAAY